MNYDTFVRLVRSGEKATVDFKIECGAFQTRNPRKIEANAELLKDICAMANNGNAASYILIGVSDNGKGFRSVLNNQLTSDAIQRLIQEYLRPVPRVRLHNCAWSKAPLKIRGKHFVVIQIGPNPRKAYHFDRDFIDWGAKICLRRNEVWVRNDTTTDIATPEQILSLLKQRSEAPASDLETNIEYQKAPKNQQRAIVRNDLIDVLTRLDIPRFQIKQDKKQSGVIFYPDDFRGLLKIRRKPFVFRFAVREHVGFHRQQTDSLWALEHGIFFLPLENPSKNVFFRPTVNYKQPWGWFTIYRSTGSSLTRRLPKGKHTAIPVLTLTGIRDTARLRDSLLKCLHFVESDDAAFAELDSARKATNKLLKHCQAFRLARLSDCERQEAVQMAEQSRRISRILSQ